MQTSLRSVLIEDSLVPIRYNRIISRTYLTLTFCFICRSYSSSVIMPFSINKSTKLESILAVNFRPMIFIMG